MIGRFIIVLAIVVAITSGFVFAATSTTNGVPPTLGMKAERLYSEDLKALSDDRSVLDKELVKLLADAKDRGWRGVAPLFYYRAALIKLKLNQIPLAEKYSELGLADMAASNFDIATRIYDDKSLAMYELVQKELTQLLTDMRSAQASVRPPRQWIKKTFPWMELDQKTTKQKRQNAQAEIAQWEKAYAKNWDYRDKDRTYKTPGHLMLSELYEQVGDHDKAIIEALAAIEYGEDGDMTWSHLGWLLIRIGALDRAADALDMASKKGDKPSGELAARLRPAYAKYLKSVKGSAVQKR